jgi:hypothetical protein
MKRLLISAAVAAAATAAVVVPSGREDGPEGRAPSRTASQRPTIEASFRRESYAPGQTAQLVISASTRNVVVRLFRAGPESTRVRSNDVMTGVEVGVARGIGAVAGRRVVAVRIENLPSGVYFAQLTAPGRVGYAPFVVRPRRLGEHRVAVVMPTHTWQAYNFRDDDGDGRPDTWYADRSHRTVRLGRPFLDRGVPPHWRYYDMPFVRWLARTGHAADYLADADLDAIGDARKLARAYDLIVFPGHHEYVTTREYDVVERYRDLGGNLMFLSANNFYWQVEKRGDTITRTSKWRDLGRPEAALIGTQFFHNDEGERRGPWIIRESTSMAWLFRGTGLRKGSAFSSGGIEADAITSSSPRGTTLVAEIPNLYGPGASAQMTYYETPAGAKVFAAGAFTLAGAVWQPPVRKLMENLWRRLSRP